MRGDSVAGADQGPPIFHRSVSVNWHYLDNGQQRGPVTEEQFSHLVQQGLIHEDTFVWRHGMEKWQRYGELASMPMPVTVPAAAAISATAVARKTGGVLRLRHEEAPVAAVRETACSQCGAVVPVIQLMTIGSRQLCPRCQVGQRRLAATAWSGGAAEYANPFLRLGAFLLDCILCWLGLVVIAFVFGFALKLLPDAPSARIGVGLVFLLVFVWWLIHYFVGRIAREGATPAMKWLRIRVVSTSGDPISWWRALARFLVIGLVNSFTLYLGHLVALFDQQKRSLHDIVCGTLVIKS